MNSQIAFVSQASASSEERAAWEWLRSCGIGEIRQIGPADLLNQLPGAAAVWWHAAAPDGEFPDLSGLAIADLLEWLRAGGSLWLTLHAATLLQRLGLEDRPPDELGWPAWRRCETELTALEGERRGVVGFGAHPLFDGLAGGAMLLQPEDGKAYPRAIYTAPVRGRVVAVDWQYLTIEPNRRIVLEHVMGAGRVLTVGAHLLFGEQANPFRGSLERFALNCVRYLSEPAQRQQSQSTYWPAVDFAPASSELGDITRIDKSGDWQFDVAGRRIVLIGRQRTGVREVWSLPVRLARDVRVRFDGIPESDALRQFRVQLGSVERLFEVRGASIRQMISAGTDEITLRFEVTGELDELELEFEADTRYFWPYPEGVLGQPRLVREGSTLRLLDGEGTARGSIRLEPWPSEFEIRPEAGSVHLRARFDEPSIVSIGFSGKWDPSANDIASEQPMLQIETPDREFDEDLSWAIQGLRAFDVETPAGRGLVAGLAETGTGWWSGRLGYAWFFGRDTIWSSFACLGSGMWEAVRESLRLLARYQSPDGKIFHELTPAGGGHVDAADSTPLFLVGLERYLRWTGGLGLLHELWPAACKALAFCFSTDRDGDGLIENSGVGHGWSEGGPVYGAHATFYLNACWAAALESMSTLAEWAGDVEVTIRCRQQLPLVRRLLHERFYQPETGWFAYGLSGDGSLMPAKTIEPAVAGLFGLLDPDRLATFFDAVASPRYSTPWGVRYIANDDPAYHPRGYHHGSVWPLFTGWVAAAEYRYGRADAAFSHVRSSLRLVRQRSFGVIDEVLNGDTGEPEGVCPHQLWSHAMTVMPVIEGMLGVQPDAVGKRLMLRPQLPPEWRFVRIRDLPVGPHALSFSYERGPHGLELVMDSAPADLQVDFDGPDSHA